MPAKSGDAPLARGVERLSRSAAYKRKGKWAIKNKVTVAKTVAEKAPITKTLKNGQTRVIREKTPRFYPAEDVAPTRPKRKATSTQKLRTTLKPGVVVILLSGRHRGKRAVFLKQLDSGLLLVTGPYKINGVPLRRVNQAYVIATKTSVDLDTVGFKVPEKFNDAYFKKPKDPKKKKTEAEFFTEAEEKKPVDQARSDDQKAVDSAVLEAVKKVETLRLYLGSRFSLKHGEHPHDMTF